MKLNASFAATTMSSSSASSREKDSFGISEDTSSTEMIAAGLQRAAVHKIDRSLQKPLELFFEDEESVRAACVEVDQKIDVASFRFEVENPSRRTKNVEPRNVVAPTNELDLVLLLRDDLMHREP